MNDLAQALLDLDSAVRPIVDSHRGTRPARLRRALASLRRAVLVATLPATGAGDPLDLLRLAVRACQDAHVGYDAVATAVNSELMGRGVTTEENGQGGAR